MFNTERGILHINKRIFQAKGNLKINEGNGFVPATLPQWEKIVYGMKLKACRVTGYAEKCKGAIPYEVSIAVCRQGK